MKKVLWIILLALQLHAEHIAWCSTYDKAHKKALKEHKPLMVLLVKKECPPCHKILRTTFQAQPYIHEVNTLFVSVVVTKGQTQSYPIEMLYTTTYPSVFFLNSEELFIGENIYGYATPDMFVKHLKLLSVRPY